MTLIIHSLSLSRVLEQLINNDNLVSTVKHILFVANHFSWILWVNPITNL